MTSAVPLRAICSAMGVTRTSVVGSGVPVMARSWQAAAE